MQTDLLEGVIYYALLSAPWGGSIAIAGDDAIVCIGLDLAEHSLRAQLRQLYGARCEHRPGHPLLRDAAWQLREYFQGRRRIFELPLRTRGTAFQQRVWKALQQIPYGETRSYGEIARAVGEPRAARAVGMACGANPIAIVVPCHRVIRANGDLGGFGGGARLKELLLNLESSHRKPARFLRPQG